MAHHELKINPEYFLEAFDGRKPFEIRKNDRDYQVGDTFFMIEYKSGAYGSRYIKGIITYVSDYMQKDGYVVFGYKLAEGYNGI